VSAKLVAWLSLFTSSGTLVCCALPALLVALGAGAALSSLVAVAPSLVILSEYKAIIFLLAGILLGFNLALHWNNRNAACPIDPVLRNACLKTRKTSGWLLAFSISIYAVGGFFAFFLPLLID
jgi:hypothetical protein